MASPFTTVELLRVTTVLQDSADQLAILGNIMPGHSAEQIVTADTGDVLQQQNSQSIHQEPPRSHRQQGSQFSLSYLSKVQHDRDFVDGVITALLDELQVSGTFNSLLHIIEEEKRRKSDIQDIILKEEEGRRKVTALQKQLQDIQKEKALKLQKQDDVIAHLKDRLQHTKTRTALEKSYVAKCSKLLVYQGQKRNAYSEKQLAEVIKQLRSKIEEEKQAHTAMEGFLKKHQTDLAEKLEMWMEQYEKDMEEKQQELSTLRNSRAQNLLQLQELARKYQHCEQVVKEDRLQKMLRHQQLGLEQMQWTAAIKVQSWWRGIRVRRGLGPYRKDKRPTPKKRRGKRK